MSRFHYDSESGFVRDTSVENENDAGAWLTTAEAVFWAMEEERQRLHAELAEVDRENKKYMQCDWWARRGMYFDPYDWKVRAEKAEEIVRKTSDDFILVSATYEAKIAELREALESIRDHGDTIDGVQDEDIRIRGEIYDACVRAIGEHPAVATGNSPEIPDGSPGITDTQRLDWLQSHLIRTKWNEADEVFDAIYAAPRGELRPVIDAAITKGAVS